MIVDDCEITLDVMKCALEEAGFEIVTSSQALGATAAILKEQPDCVLMDVSMPALSGTEIVRLVKQRSDIKMLLFSATGERELMQLADACRADGCITKGQDASKVVALIRAVVSRKPRNALPLLAKRG
jgi:DNA-binding NarL/FixJ family response regulator